MRPIFIFGAMLLAGAAFQAGETTFPRDSIPRPCAPDSTPGTGLVVGLDNFFNNEWKVNADGTKQRFHYVWEDSANSGFSILGGIVHGLGYAVTGIPRAPDPRTLAALAVYIIVDPDTPLETEHPNFMNEESAGIIEAWVRAGGILLLLANDRGNCDLEHLNILAGRFGIRFNEDSRHRVEGKDYETGANAELPSHPVFSGVRKIFTKEVSSLALTSPAQPLLSEGAVVLMAVSRVGRGTVFAVGDPWLYNEYMDNRRLPDGFDNPRCAQNLFRWLATLVPDRAPEPGSASSPPLNWK